MGPGLQRRLLLLLLAPLLLLAALNTWFDFQFADTAAIQQDRQLLTLVAPLVDSILARRGVDKNALNFEMTPAITDFLATRPGLSGYAVLSNEGKVLVGDAWLGDYPPATYEPEFSSQEYRYVVFRIVSQRVLSAAGELTVRLADGSDMRMQWFRRLWFRVALPNLVLAVGAVFAVNWAVRRALRPLFELKEAVEGRSPRDLTLLDAAGSPDEVRPLVKSLNRLFGLVNAQAESQRRFVADAAHQLRTPIAGLQAQVEAWAQTAENQKKAEDSGDGRNERTSATSIIVSTEQVLKLREACRRTSKLANQLLALSRADAPISSAHTQEAVDLKQLSDQVFEENLDAASLKLIDFGLETEPVLISGHEWLMRELINNLVDNAIKYTPTGGQVTLKCGTSKEGADGQTRAFLEVQDNGPGLPIFEIARVTQRFYRVPGSPGVGNGLGLAIANEIASLHNGTLSISSVSVGSGLSVRVLFKMEPKMIPKDVASL